MTPQVCITVEYTVMMAQPGLKFAVGTLAHAKAVGSSQAAERPCGYTLCPSHPSQREPGPFGLVKLPSSIQSPSSPPPIYGTLAPTDRRAISLSS